VLIGSAAARGMMAGLVGQSHCLRDSRVHIEIALLSNHWTSHVLWEHTAKPLEDCTMVLESTSFLWLLYRIRPSFCQALAVMFARQVARNFRAQRRKSPCTESGRTGARRRWLSYPNRF